MNEPLKPWGAEEKQAWFLRQRFSKSYKDDIVTRLRALPADKLVVEQYGALTCDPERYPLYAVRSANWDDSKPSLLITGGVHGYEPSGIFGALRCLEEVAPEYDGRINFLVYPCVSPIAYEINHRWNNKTEDPNRSFCATGTAEESLSVMKSVESLGKHFAVALDLHETNWMDTPTTAERRARDGQHPEPDDSYIPEGFYLYGSTEEDIPLGRKIVDAVRPMTAICAETEIFGSPCDKGLIIANNILSACQAFSTRHADHAMTTEISPDKGTPREAQDSQVAAVRAAVEFVLKP